MLSLRGIGNPLRALESAVNDRAADLERAENDLVHHTAALDAARQALAACTDRKAWGNLDHTLRFEQAAVERATGAVEQARAALEQARAALDGARRDRETRAVRKRIAARRESIAQNVRSLVALVEDARALASAIDMQAQLDANDSAAVGDAPCDLLGTVGEALLDANPGCALPQERSNFWYVSPLDGTNFGRQREQLKRQGLAAIVAPSFACPPASANTRNDQRAWLAAGVAAPVCASAAAE
jgi:hypothetical protein